MMPTSLARLRFLRRAVLSGFLRSASVRHLVTLISLGFVIWSVSVVLDRFEREELSYPLSCGVRCKLKAQNLLECMYQVWRVSESAISGHTVVRCKITQTNTPVLVEDIKWCSNAASGILLMLHFLLEDCAEGG